MGGVGYAKQGDGVAWKREKRALVYYEEKREPHRNTSGSEFRGVTIGQSSEKKGQSSCPYVRSSAGVAQHELRYSVLFEGGVGAVPGPLPFCTFFSERSRG